MPRIACVSPPPIQLPQNYSPHPPASQRQRPPTTPSPEHRKPPPAPSPLPSSNAIRAVPSTFRQTASLENLSLAHVYKNSRLLPTPTPVRIKVPRFIVHPESSLKLFWDCLILMLLSYSIIMVPMQIAFEFSPHTTTIYFWVELVFDLLFLCDIVMNARTAFWHETSTSRVLVTCAKDIFWRYLRTWLVLDILGSIPFGLFVEREEAPRYNRFLRLPKILKALRMLRFLRLARRGWLRKYYKLFTDSVLINPGVIRVLRLLLVAFIMSHFAACTFFFFGAAGGGHNTWVYQYQMIHDDGSRSRLIDMDALPQYLISIYWSITTMTTIGYGDIIPVSQAEIWTVIFVQIIGASMFAFIVGNMASLLSRLNSRSSEHRANMSMVDEFMHQTHLPVHLRVKVRKYLEHCYAAPTVKVSNDVLKQLSPALRTEVVLTLHHDLILKVPFFRDKDVNFLTEVVMKLAPLQVAPADVIFRNHEHNNTMFFLSSGEAEIVLGDLNISEEPLFATLGPGSYFGENALLTDEDHRPATVQAVTWCDLFKLGKSDLDLALAQYPAVAKQFKELADQRKRKLKNIFKAQRHMSRFIGGQPIRLAAAMARTSEHPPSHTNTLTAPNAPSTIKKPSLTVDTSSHDHDNSQQPQHAPPKHPYLLPSLPAAAARLGAARVSPEASPRKPSPLPAIPSLGDHRLSVSSSGGHPDAIASNNSSSSGSPRRRRRSTGAIAATVASSQADEARPSSKRSPAQLLGREALHAPSASSPADDTNPSSKSTPVQEGNEATVTIAIASSSTRRSPRSPSSKSTEATVAVAIASSPRRRSLAEEATPKSTAAQQQQQQQQQQGGIEVVSALEGAGEGSQNDNGRATPEFPRKALPPLPPQPQPQPPPPPPPAQEQLGAVCESLKNMEEMMKAMSEQLFNQSRHLTQLTYRMGALERAGAVGRTPAHHLDDNYTRTPHNNVYSPVESECNFEDIEDDPLFGICTLAEGDESATGLCDN